MEGNKTKIKNKDIAFCTLMYALSFILINMVYPQRLFPERNFIRFLILLAFCSWTFYFALYGIKYKKISLRGFVFEKESALFLSILAILFYLFILIAPLILT